MRPHSLPLTPAARDVHRLCVGSTPTRPQLSDGACHRLASLRKIDRNQFTRDLGNYPSQAQPAPTNLSHMVPECDASVRRREGTRTTRCGLKQSRCRRQRSPITETLEVIPRRWKVIQTVREKFT